MSVLRLARSAGRKEVHPAVGSPLHDSGLMPPHYAGDSPLQEQRGIGIFPKIAGINVNVK